MRTSRHFTFRCVTVIFALAALLLTNLISASAFAEHPRDLEVAFDELDVRVVDGELHTTYEIDRRDWRELQRLRIRPRLNLYTENRRGTFEFAYSVPLSYRTATVAFPADVTPYRARAVEVRLSGERGRTRIARTSYGHDCSTRVRVAVYRPASPRHHPTHPRRPPQNDVALINACSANTSWSGDLDKCIVKASAISHGAPDAVNACGAATSWSGDFLSCLDHAATIRRNHVGAIQACSAATSWAGDFKQCLQTAATYHGDATPTIHACSAATDWAGDFNHCLVAARRT